MRSTQVRKRVCIAHTGYVILYADSLGPSTVVTSTSYCLEIWLTDKEVVGHLLS